LQIRRSFRISTPNTSAFYASERLKNTQMLQHI